MSPFFSNPSRLFTLAIGLCVIGTGLALFTQHVLDMQPCPWCILQRMIMMCVALVALLGLVWRSRAGSLASAAGVGLLAVCGMAAALWQHFVASRSQSCNLTLADRIVSGSGLDGLAPEVFAARASCADAAGTLWGVPYEFWSLASFAVLLAVALLVGLSKRRP